MWEADLVTGALRDEMHAAGLPRLFGQEVELLLPDERRVPVGGGIGGTQFGQQFARRRDADDLEERVRAVGLRLLEVDFYTPRDLAVAIVVEVTNRDRFLDEANPHADAIFGWPPLYEGYYFEARTPDGKPIHISRVACRTGVGGRWFPRRPMSERWRQRLSELQRRSEGQCSAQSEVPGFHPLGGDPFWDGPPHGSFIRVACQREDGHDGNHRAENVIHDGDCTEWHDGPYG